VKAIQEGIKSYPYGDSPPEVTLIIGVRFKRTGDTAMFHISAEGGVRTVYGAGIFIGAGAEVAQSFARIVWHQLFPSEIMLPIAMFILYQSKMSADSCGGDTELFRLPKTGGMGIWSDEGIAEQIEHAMRLTLVESRDKDGISDALFEDRVNEYATKLKDIRKAVQRAQASKDFAIEILRNAVKQRERRKPTAFEKPEKSQGKSSNP
jgi:hypothetical protein